MPATEDCAPKHLSIGPRFVDVEKGVIATDHSWFRRALRYHYETSMETEGFRDAAFEPAWIEPRLCVSPAISNPAATDDGVMADGMANPSLNALLG